MMARPPPARPGLSSTRPSGIRASFSADWAEDDAWDSGSDSESKSPSSSIPSTSRASRPRQPSLVNSRTQSISASVSSPAASTSASGSIGSGSATSTTTTLPRPVVLTRKQNTSSSTLGSSYTHVHTPSPSSFPQKGPHPLNGPRDSTDSSIAPSEVEVGAGSPPAQNGWTVVRAGQDPNDTPDMVEDLEASTMTDEVPDGGYMRLGRNAVVNVVREDVDMIVNDPMVLVREVPREIVDDGISNPSPSHPLDADRLAREKSIKANRRKKFVDTLTAETLDIYGDAATLRKLGWAGIPPDLRPVAWPLLLGYMPLPLTLRSSTVARKRTEYASLVDLAFARGKSGLDPQIWHQIEIDVPRTRPGVPLWMHGATQRSLERILYVWAIRHPASGYVQGINDLATPFYQVFLSAYIDSNPEHFDPSLLPPSAAQAAEADTFWCLTRLLDGITDNYIAGQPGIQRSVRRMAELVGRIDPPLALHLGAQGVEFMQFAFRWMNCLLMREISVENTVRMWDTYLAEGTEAFSQFHLYVCAAFLVKWSDTLREMDFQGIIMFLQSLPTQNWTDDDIEVLLSRAFVLSSTWQNAQSHFQK